MRPNAKRACANLVLCVICGSLVAQQPTPALDQDVNESPVVEEPQLTPAAPNARETSPVTPPTEARFGELTASQNQEILMLVNERLRQEVELLAQENRDAKETFALNALWIGGGIALVFFGLGTWIGYRLRANRRLM